MSIRHIKYTNNNELTKLLKNEVHLVVLGKGEWAHKIWATDSDQEANDLGRNIQNGLMNLGNPNNEQVFLYSKPN